MTRKILSTLALILVTTSPALAGGATREPSTPAATERALTPRQMAEQAFDAGLVERDRAWKLEKKLDGLGADKRAKTESKIRKAYERAAKQYEAALEHDPNHYQALASLGYATRQLGDYERALEYYGKSLSITPDYPEALEYRAEAYLALDRPDDALAEWETLKQLDASLADQLAVAVKDWVGARRGGSTDLDVGDLDRIERWADERLAGKDVAAVTKKSRSW